MNSSTDDGDKETVGHRTIAQLVWILKGGTRPAIHSPKFYGGWKSESFVPTQESENQPNHKGRDTAVGVGQLPVEHQRQLWEDDDEHEVTAEDKEIVDAAVDYGKDGRDDAVDDDANVQGNDHLLFTTVGTNHLEQLPGACAKQNKSEITF